MLLIFHIRTSYYRYLNTSGEITDGRIVRASKILLVRIMRIIDFRVGRGRARIVDLRRRLNLTRRLSTVRNQLRILRELRYAEQDVALREARSALIAMSSLNLNTVEEEHFLIDVRVRRNEIRRIAELSGWDGGWTEKNG